MVKDETDGSNFRSTYKTCVPTVDCPDWTWFTDAVVGIKGKLHWALVESSGNIRIVRNDGQQVEFIQCSHEMRMFAPIGHVYTYFQESGSGTYVDHAEVALNKRDSEAKYFFEMGKNAITAC